MEGRSNLAFGIQSTSNGVCDMAGVEMVVDVNERGGGVSLFFWMACLMEFRANCGSICEELFEQIFTCETRLLRGYEMEWGVKRVFEIRLF